MAKSKTKLSILLDVKQELARFSERLDLAIKEQEQPNAFSSRHYAASKRGALDLKNELTKLTQDSKYLWS